MKNDKITKFAYFLKCIELLSSKKLGRLKSTKSNLNGLQMRSSLTNNYKPFVTCHSLIS